MAKLGADDFFLRHGAPLLAPCSRRSRPPLIPTSLPQGKNNNKPVKRPSAPVDAEVEESEKPFHSSVFEQERLNSLINAPERQTWDEFKETLRKKGEMDGDETRLQEEAQRRFRKELDEARTTRRVRDRRDA